VGVFFGSKSTLTPPSNGRSSREALVILHKSASAAIEMF